MNRTIFSLFKQDIVLTWRNKLILVTVITFAIIVALYWTLPFMVKEEEPLTQSQVFLDLTEGGVITGFLNESNTLEIASDREELEEIVTERTGITGVVITGDIDDLRYELVFRNRPSDETIRILEATYRGITQAVRDGGVDWDIDIQLLRDEVDPIAPNESLILVMLAFEVLILGFLFIAVVVFGEKKEGSIRAYRVSPSGLANYIVSKTMVFTVLSLVYGLVMVVSTVGIGPDFGALALILAVSCALMTLLGLGVAVFFENLSQWFVPGVFLLSINMLAIIPFQIPSYSMRALTYLPGYNVIFGASEALFSTGKSGYLGPVMSNLGVGLVIAAVFAVVAVRKKMMREG